MSDYSLTVYKQIFYVTLLVGLLPQTFVISWNVLKLIYQLYLISIHTYLIICYILSYPCIPVFAHVLIWVSNCTFNLFSNSFYSMYYVIKLYSVSVWIFFLEFISNPNLYIKCVLCTFLSFQCFKTLTESQFAHFKYNYF